MGLSSSDKERVINTIQTCLRAKFSSYRPETVNMPFHYRLLGKDRMALFSFIHSLNTTFGVSIYEPVAKELALTRFKEVKTQYKFGNIITEGAQNEIQNIMNHLSVGGDVDKDEESERIRKVCRVGVENKLKPVKVDLMVVSKNDEVFMFDLKTVKPNITDFVAYKRTMLEWLAIYLFQNPTKRVNTLIAIPYNPYEPEPYERWTMKGMFDLDKEVMVAEEFWDFLGGNGAYIDLLDCFEKAGIALRPEIDAYFSKFKR